MATTIGENIRTARHTAGMSQSLLARTLAVAEYTIRRWEQDRATPSVATLRRIAEALGVSVSWLLGEGPEPYSPPFP